MFINIKYNLFSSGVCAERQSQPRERREPRDGVGIWLRPRHDRAIQMQFSVILIELPGQCLGSLNVLPRKKTTIELKIPPELFMAQKLRHGDT